MYASLEGSSVYKLSGFTVWGAGGSITMGLLRRPIYHRINIYTYKLIYRHLYGVYLYVYIIYLRLYVFCCFDPHQRQIFLPETTVFVWCQGAWATTSTIVHEKNLSTPFGRRFKKTTPTVADSFRPCTPKGTETHLILLGNKGGFHTGLFFAAMCWKILFTWHLADLAYLGSLGPLPSNSGKWRFI